MKNIKIIIVLLAVTLFSCSDDETTYPLPNWEVNQNAVYTTTMSAIVVLPSNLTNHVTDDDVLGAFVGEDCRAIAELVEEGDTRYYFFTIKGFHDESTSLRFKYYNTKNSYLFETSGNFNFKPDEILGTVDNPLVLDLRKL